MDDNGVGLVCDRAEQTRLGEVVQDYTTKIQYRDPYPVIMPIGVCPQCGVDYLPSSYRTVINLMIPPTISARVIDSNGLTVAKPTLVGGIQQLRFEPRAFTGLALRTSGLTLAYPADGAKFRVVRTRSQWLDTTEPGRVHLLAAHQLGGHQLAHQRRPADTVLPSLLG